MILEDQLLASIAYVLPALVTGYVAYYMFKSYLTQQNSDKSLALLMDKKRESLPVKLQAYERMLLFCERIHPTKLVLRIQPISDSSSEYVSLLILTIEQEFEHNLVQQLYVSEEAWSGILIAKNTVIQIFTNTLEKSKTANEIIENILIDCSKSKQITETAIEIIKIEVKKVL